MFNRVSFSVLHLVSNIKSIDSVNSSSADLRTKNGLGYHLSYERIFKKFNLFFEHSSNVIAYLEPEGFEVRNLKQKTISFYSGAYFTKKRNYSFGLGLEEFLFLSEADDFLQLNKTKLLFLQGEYHSKIQLRPTWKILYKLGIGYILNGNENSIDFKNGFYLSSHIRPISFKWEDFRFYPKLSIKYRKQDTSISEQSELTYRFSIGSSLVF